MYCIGQCSLSNRNNRLSDNTEATCNHDLVKELSGVQLRVQNCQCAITVTVSKYHKQKMALCGQVVNVSLAKRVLDRTPLLGRMMGQTDRQTDGRTPDRYIDPAPSCQKCRTAATSVYSTEQRQGSPCSITKHRVPELIPVLGSQPAGNVSHKPGGRLPLLSARLAVTLATLKRAATHFAAW